MKLSGRTQMLSNQYSIMEILKIFKDSGFDGVELCFEDNNFHLRPDLLENFMIEAIVEECNRLNLQISAVSNHMQYFYDDFMFEHLKREIRCTKKYGTDIFILSAMSSGMQKIQDSRLPVLAANRLGELCKIAEEEQITLALEPEPLSIVGSVQEYFNMLAVIDSTALKVNLDIGHAFLTEENMFTTMEKLGDRIVHCHVEDMQRGQHLHLLPGDGDIEFPKVFGKLKEIGFDGYLSLDLYGFAYDKVAADAVKTLREVIVENT